ncbi:MAG TPA: adenylate/guanylate cyclase domain-containing protein, partial [Anaerolineales bacterium]|nr:adenylate/guanylate cyclase domain-containing protein [Anaerolineales bacterium]
MHRVVPELVVENFQGGRQRGEFYALGMFLDLSGFSTMTDVLMQHGQHGAEALAGLMHSVFDPLVESIFQYGGKVTGFAGDGVMALFPIESDVHSVALKAVASAYIIQKRFEDYPTRQTVYGTFPVSAKIGLAYGSVSWGIVSSPEGDQATYYFRGSAVDACAQAEQHARPGDVLLDESVWGLLADGIETESYGSYQRLTGVHFDLPATTRIGFPPVDLEVSRRFMPAEVIAYDVRGEFRQNVNLFMRFPDLSEAQLDELIRNVFDLRAKYGGLLSRLDFGDKGCNLLMLWGAPVAYENDIARALNFLLELKSRLDFQVTSGVTYYIAHAGYLGSALCEDYTCYGWGVNLAARFMMTAPSGETWIDDRIARRVSSRFEIEFVGSQFFKGFASEQRVHRLLRHRDSREPVYQGELVGRREELEKLEAFAAPVSQGRFAGIMLVVGDAGIGKGRLVYEFRSLWKPGMRRVLWAVCQSDQVLRQSFQPLRYWLLSYFGFMPNQPLLERYQIFDRTLNELIADLPEAALAQEIDRTRSVLGALLDLHWANSLYEQLDAEGRYNNTFLALIALLKAESLRQPVVLFLEDLHFTDPDSRDLLPRLRRSMLAAGQAYPIAIIV